jgi:hypothetical protein
MKMVLKALMAKALLWSKVWGDLNASKQLKLQIQ